MAGTASDESGVGRSVEGVSSEEHFQSGEALAEWRSSEQVENGTPSTSPPYWDTDDDDDGGPKPSELYGKYTWKIEKFSQINKRELRSNAFEVGGYKWYILIYPQGCDVCNHLSLFLCVANHDKLLPGWSHFAQFTIAVVNKDPKKSKYSDTLHRFWKKEHDWGWKKFMELSKVLDGFIELDTLIIKAQVQVIREKADRPFRCLDCLYRRELVRVYLTNVEQICRRFVEERRGKLEKLIKDKARWSSFCAFWLGIEPNARRRMSREKIDVILKVVVKHFFIEKEVTSTLVMDSLYSGLKALEGQSKSKKERLKLLDSDEFPAPVVQVEKDVFVLVDDVLLLLERAALEPLPPKEDKGPQNRTKDGNSGEDFNKDSIVRDERRLTELGRRTVELFVLAHIFSNKIEVAYQEAVALKRQEELIREEEAAWQVESEQKAKRGATEKEKKSKKKQAKQKRTNRKGKDKGREEMSSVSVQDKFLSEHHKNDVEDFATEQAQPMLEKPSTLEDVSDLSDSVDVVDVLRPDLEERDASPVNSDTDTSEIHPSIEASNSGISGMSSMQNETTRKSPSVMDDSSSTCSTDSVPSVSLSAPLKGNAFLNCKKKSPSRGKNQQRKAASDGSVWANEVDNQSLGSAVEAGDVHAMSASSKAVEPESGVFQFSNWPELKKEEEVPVPKKVSIKDQADIERPKEKTVAVPSSPKCPPKNVTSTGQPKPEHKSTGGVESIPARKAYSNGPKPINKAAPLMIKSQITSMSKPETLQAVALKVGDKAVGQLVPVVSRPSSAPITPASKPTLATTPVSPSVAQTAPSLARSVSAAGRLAPDLSTATQTTYVPQSYRNAIIGNTGSSYPSGHLNSTSSGVNTAQVYSHQPSLVSAPMFLHQSSERGEGFPFGMAIQDVLQNGPQWMESSQRRASNSDSASLRSDIQNFDLYDSVHGEQLSGFNACTSGRPGGVADEFPHLDIINELLDDEHGASVTNNVFQSHSNGSHFRSRQYSFPSELGDMGSSSSSCGFERSRSYQDEVLRRSYSRVSGNHYEQLRDFAPQSNPLPYPNSQIDGTIPNHWLVAGSDLSLLGTRNVEGDGYPYYNPEYSNQSSGGGHYTMFRPSNGH